MDRLSLPSALLFDLDGTLVDTAPDLARATNALRAHHGLSALPYPRIRSQVSNGGSALVEMALGLGREQAGHESARQYLLDRYSEALAVESLVFTPLETLLQHWIMAGRPWGIVTNKPRAYAAPLVRALELEPDVLLCADDLPMKKPDPAPLHEAARRLDVASEKCWYIGDHHRDVQAARAAGMIAVAVGYGYLEAPDDHRHWSADFCFDTPEALVHALTKAPTDIA
ncbi:HAD-IA family hydrolase [Halomonas sp. 18H]|uniref:HAD-IA family hydrolase n=1 Tax=Halomonas almeriensis TaxID=308163 RepID=UPI002230DD71|nr:MULTISPECIES: HAD-IA family hydrolase [Halomonas]MCW4151849.1 HAD-IA family hydrolase [Halomonas sp. 18H]MDN3554095.1 HAD-IA family hydrolase [Halomonas almeriensis]